MTTEIAILAAGAMFLIGSVVAGGIIYSAIDRLVRAFGEQR